MSIDVTAIDGDTLCGIAIAAGFLDCAPLRAEAANQPFLSRPLVAGDKVTVPDLNLKELSKSVDKKHVFRKEERAARLGPLRSRLSRQEISRGRYALGSSRQQLRH
jgi:hypothetical protein